jgi:hypothetical protein
MAVRVDETGHHSFSVTIYDCGLGASAFTTGAVLRNRSDAAIAYMDKFSFWECLVHSNNIGIYEKKI